mgnify:CR=1 FL=1
MSERGCLEDEEARKFLFEKEPVEWMQVVRDHLKVCGTCDAEVRRLRGITTAPPQGVAQWRKRTFGVDV